MQTPEVLEHFLYLRILAMNSLVELLARSVKARLLNLLHLIFVRVLLPRQGQVEELEHDEEEAPEIIFTAKFFLHVG